MVTVQHTDNYRFFFLNDDGKPVDEKIGGEGPMLEATVSDANPAVDEFSDESTRKLAPGELRELRARVTAALPRRLRIERRRAGGSTADR